jgi:AcrR family transcriptional regulator
MVGARVETTLAAPRRQGARNSTRQKADSLLRAAAALIAEKGFEATAIRDVGRRLELSLGGMYYYFASKDDLLFQIQYRTFQALLEAQERTAAQAGAPAQRLRRLLAGHLAFFAQHPSEMKICTYELESLGGEFYDQVLAVRRRYYRIMADVVAELANGWERRRHGADPSDAEKGASRQPRAATKARESARSRHLTLFIFGMLNWAFMWYRAAKDGPVEGLADEMVAMVLHGIGKQV